MPQLTIYLPEDLHQAIRARARERRVSVSAWMAELARKALKPGDAAHQLAALYGSCESLVEAQDPPPEPLDL